MRALLFSCYILLLVASRSNCTDTIVYISSLNEDSIPDDNITEVTSVFEVQFPCDVSQVNALPPATNVHELRPTDVKVIGAIGDSMTAALFAKVSDVLGLIPSFFNKHKYEYRGVSWSVGGDSGVTTLPNLIKHYNSELTGYSVKTGKEGSKNAAYNFAVSGAVASDLLGQAQLLVDRIKSDNLDNEWKVITIFIGGNDLCAICDDRETFSKENFYSHLVSAIDKLSELNKVFINLVQTVEVSKVATLPTLGCTLIQGLIDLFGTCKCVNQGLSKEQNEYKEKIIEVENHFKSQLPERDDFVVVVQPFFGKTTIPTVNPTSYFAPDCFHLSQKGMLQASVSLWNNMLEPVGSKTDELLVDQLVKCPTVLNPYFYTHENSDSSVNSLGGVPGGNDAPENPLTTGQTIGVVVGTLLVVAVAVGMTVGGVVGFYFKNRKPTFSQYTSLSKAARV
eukprot:TRINITY_DN2007_c0_g1_i3.p1 TRINITY_DN2007_c0_g1~~TRINITY_DN2007_c0_g1_i3.p1  ORF type:complete len:451 (+),score=52.30 TRINITY_DN2007_c0_g1_i3:105-1457(+)